MPPGVLVPPDQLRRLGRASLLVEQMGVPPTGAAFGTVPESTMVDRSFGVIRAVLCEPLYGHGSATAVVSARRRFEPMIDVQVMGKVSAMGQTFKLTCNLAGADSDAISVEATAAQMSAALAPWQLGNGAVFVSHGSIAAQQVPMTIRPQAAAPFVLARWTLAFIGPAFAGKSIVVTPQSDFPDHAVVICHRSTWEATNEFVQVFEAGLIPDQVQVSNYNASSFFIPAGSAIVAAYCPAASGWVVIAAETRKYQGRTQ